MSQRKIRESDVVAADLGGRRSARHFRFSDIAIYVAFVGLFIVFAVSLKDVGNGFASVGNLLTILQQTSLIAVMAVGMAFVLGAAQIDLSVGSTVGLVSLVAALGISQFGLVLGTAGALLVGAVIGALNGLIIAVLRIPAFLVTLGTMITVAGVSRTITNLQSIPITSPDFIFVFGGGNVARIPIVAFWMLATVVVGHLILTKTPTGRRVLATGGNPRSAVYSGINTRKVIFGVMFASSLLASLAGILWAGRFGGGWYSLGDGAELSVIAATVLGGTSIFGGVASVIGAAVGAVMIGMIDNALVLYGLNVYQQEIIRGIIIVVAVIVTTRRS
jgi:ribose transport system permease protein